MPDSLSSLLDRLRSPAPEISDPPQTEDLAAWRSRIDLVDRIVLLLLNERSDCANAIGRIKKHLGMPVYVPSREDQVISNVRQNNPGPLPDHAVQHLFERIIDETRSLERQRYQDEFGEPDDSEARTDPNAPKS